MTAATETSLPDPAVMGKLCEYLAYVHSQFPWLRPLEKVRRGDMGWEIAGFHPGGTCIAVRCHFVHACGDGRPADETLNAFMARHLQETKGVCALGHHWEATIRDRIDSMGGTKLCDFIVEKLTSPESDLAPLCRAIRSRFVGDHEKLDVHDAMPSRRKYVAMPPASLASLVTVTEVSNNDDDDDKDMDMDDGDEPRTWTARGVWCGDDDGDEEEGETDTRWYTQEDLVATDRWYGDVPQPDVMGTGGDDDMDVQ